MRVRLWGTRGSLASPGPETARYGGNTACVEVRHADGTALVLDAGTGARRLGAAFDPAVRRVDILLSHLHLDHVQGLPFFAPLRDPAREVHVWGPAHATRSLRARLGRYLSPPLFPVYLRDLPWVQVHELAGGEVAIGSFRVACNFVNHLDPTLGYRVTAGNASLAYLPDHEPALGLQGPYLGGDWTSGYALAAGADLLVHDGQYTDAEYAARVGWGHSSVSQAIGFAAQAGARHLVLFHHDPSHTDADLDHLIADATTRASPPFPVSGAMEGTTFDLD